MGNVSGVLAYRREEGGRISLEGGQVAGDGDSNDEGGAAWKEVV